MWTSCGRADPEHCEHLPEVCDDCRETKEELDALDESPPLTPTRAALVLWLLSIDR